MKVGVLVLVVGVLVACSPLDLIKGATGSGPSLAVETVVGDKEEAVIGKVGDSTEVQAESFTGGINTTNVQDVPPWVMLLLILGWLLPDPKSIYNEIKSWFKRKVK